MRHNTILRKILCDMANLNEKPKRGLTNKQQMFVREYLVDLNATQAAIRAGYSAKTATWIGPQLLWKTHVAQAIQAEMDKRAAKIDVTAEKVIAELAKMAFANLQDFYDKDGSLKDIHSLPRDVAAALSQVETNLTEACAVQKVKLHDKRGALELLGKHLKLFTDRIEHSGEITVEIVRFGENKDSASE